MVGFQTVDAGGLRGDGGAGVGVVQAPTQDDADIGGEQFHVGKVAADHRLPGVAAVGPGGPAGAELVAAVAGLGAPAFHCQVGEAGEGRPSGRLARGRGR